MYHYTECGLNYIYLKNGFDEHDTPYGRAISIHDLDGLHRAIAMDIVKNRAVLSGDELRFLRIELGFSQKRLGDIVSRQAQTIALWEKGKQKIHEGADKFVRLVVLDWLKETPHVVEFVDRVNELDRLRHECKRLFSKTDDQWSAAA